MSQKEQMIGFVFSSHEEQIYTASLQHPVCVAELLYPPYDRALAQSPPFKPK